MTTAADSCRRGTQLGPLPARSPQQARNRHATTHGTARTPPRSLGHQPALSAAAVTAQRTAHTAAAALASANSLRSAQHRGTTHGTHAAAALASANSLRSAQHRGTTHGTHAAAALIRATAQRTPDTPPRSPRPLRAATTA
jgi:hypothetical protein